jgi:hypothetical protein
MELTSQSLLLHITGVPDSGSKGSFAWLANALAACPVTNVQFDSKNAISELQEKVFYAVAYPFQIATGVGAAWETNLKPLKTDSRPSFVTAIRTSWTQRR